MHNLENARLVNNSDMLKPGWDPDGYCFYFFISTFNFLITANILKFRHELLESNINSALSSKAAITAVFISIDRIDLLVAQRGFGKLRQQICQDLL